MTSMGARARLRRPSSRVSSPSPSRRERRCLPILRHSRGHPAAEWPMLAAAPGSSSADVGALEYLLRAVASSSPSAAPSTVRYRAVRSVQAHGAGGRRDRWARRRGRTRSSGCCPQAWQHGPEPFGPFHRGWSPRQGGPARHRHVAGARTRKETGSASRSTSGTAWTGSPGPSPGGPAMALPAPRLGSTTCAYSRRRPLGRRGNDDRHLGNAGARDCIVVRRAGWPSGHISREHGGFFPPLRAIGPGLDADIRPMRKGDGACQFGASWQSASYARRGTRILIVAIRKAALPTGQGHLVQRPGPHPEGLHRLHAGPRRPPPRRCTVTNPDINSRC